MSPNPAGRYSAGGLDSRIWKSHGGDTRQCSNFPGRKRRGYRLDGGRDTFICGLLMHEQPGLISLQRSQEPGSERSQANGKMFLFSSLKLFIKGSLLLRSRTTTGRSRRIRRCDSWKRDCGLLTATSPAFSYISYLRFSRSHAGVFVGLPV